MPVDRLFRPEHPETCTCVSCVERRSREAAWSQTNERRLGQSRVGRLSHVIISAVVRMVVVAALVYFAWVGWGIWEDYSNTSEFEASEVEEMVHDLVNEYRFANGRPALSADTALSSIARQHSSDMAQDEFFAHNNLRGQDPTARVGTAKYGCRKDHGSYYTDGIGENISQTWLYSSTRYLTWVIRIIRIRDYMTNEQIAKQIVDGWIASPGHRENMLSNRYDRVGTGVAVSSDEKVLATQDFC